MRGTHTLYFIALCTAYELEDFASALKSCMSEETFYLHIKGDLYFAVKPRTPFIYTDSHYQSIPEAKALYQNIGVEYDDLVVMIMVGVFLIVGACCTAHKLRCYSRCTSEIISNMGGANNMRRTPPKSKSTGIQRLWSSSFEFGGEETFSPYFFRSSKTERSFPDSGTGDDVVGDSENESALMLPVRSFRKGSLNFGSPDEHRGNGDSPIKDADLIITTAAAPSVNRPRGSPRDCASGGAAAATTTTTTAGGASSAVSADEVSSIVSNEGDFDFDTHL